MVNFNIEDISASSSINLERYPGTLSIYIKLVYPSGVWEGYAYGG